MTSFYLLTGVVRDQSGGVVQGGAWVEHGSRIPDPGRNFYTAKNPVQVGTVAIYDILIETVRHERTI